MQNAGITGKSANLRQHICNSREEYYLYNALFRKQFNENNRKNL